MNENINDYREYIDEIIATLGDRRAICMLLMAYGNVLKHLSEHPELYNKIMKDPVVAICGHYALKFFEIKDKADDGKKEKN